jgi:hypothetical protein
MADDKDDNKTNKIKNVINVEGVNESRGFLALPFDRDEFADFLASLLGKPQTLRRLFSGSSFSIDLGDIRDFHYLLQQRLNQQNLAQLVAFSATIYFDDNSSVELSSFETFETYNEVRPLISDRLELTWNFLVQFMDKTTPEKQTVIIIVQPNEPRRDRINFLDRVVSLVDSVQGNQRGSQILLEIQHTARTWASDIEAMLTNHIQTLLSSPNRIQSFLYKYRSILLFFLFFLGTTLLATAYNNIRTRDKDLLRKATELSIINQPNVSDKIDALASVVLSGQSFVHITVLALFVALFVSTLATFLITDLVESPVHSFLLLTKKSSEYEKKTLERVKKNWLLILIGVIINLLLGLASNYIFSLFF